MAIIQINTNVGELQVATVAPKALPDLEEVGDEPVVVKSVAIAQKPAFKASLPQERVKVRDLTPRHVKSFTFDDYGDVTVWRQPIGGVGYRFDLFNEDGVLLNEQQPFWEVPKKAAVRNLLISFYAVAETTAEVVPEDELQKTFNVKCQYCPTHFEIISTDKARPSKQKHTCKECAVWERRLALPKGRSIVYKGQHWTNGSMVPHGIKGSGGEVFQIDAKDGTNTQSSDMWPNGKVPKHWRKKFPDNVKRVISLDEWMLAKRKKANIKLTSVE